MSNPVSEAKVTSCLRCGMPVRLNPTAGSEAIMLRRAKTPEGLCLACATHDWLRNTYPVNMLLAEGGPSMLLNVSVREQFAVIMTAANSDARPEEIDWNRIVEFWDLPFPDPVKPSAANPMTQQELDEIAAGETPAFGARPLSEPDPLVDQTTFTSFEQLDQLEPGLGSRLRQLLAESTSRQEEKSDDEEPEPPARQQTFW